MVRPTGRLYQRVHDEVVGVISRQDRVGTPRNGSACAYLTNKFGWPPLPAETAEGSPDASSAAAAAVVPAAGSGRVLEVGEELSERTSDSIGPGGQAAAARCAPFKQRDYKQQYRRAEREHGEPTERI